MPRSGAARALLVLLACAVLGGVIQAVTTMRELGIEGFGSYPLGLLPVALLQVGGVRDRAWVAAAAAVSTALVMWATGQSAAESWGYGVGAAVAAVVTVVALGRTARPEGLRTEGDLLRLLRAVLAGSLVMGGAATLTGGVLGLPDLGGLALASTVLQCASLLLWVPLALAPRPGTALAGSWERLLQWGLLVGSAAVIFQLDSYPGFLYVPLALLAWAGLRFALLETLVQLIVVRTIALTLTLEGRGAEVAVVGGLDLSPDLLTLFTQLFLIVCSVTVVALNLSSNRQRDAIKRLTLAEAGAAADRQLISVVEELEAERGMVEELRELDRVKDAFVSMVSHELRTPITNIIGYSEMLEDGDYGHLSAPQSSALERINDNSRRLLFLIDDLLTLSRLRSAELELNRAPVDLVAVVRAAERIILPRVRSAGLSLEMDLGTSPLVVEGDQEQLERVLVNLMSNAVKFTPQPGRITVRLRPEGEAAVITVADTGYGIAPEEVDKLFSQFFRSTVAQEQHIPGSGLGLSIVRAIVEGHGGRVGVESTLGQGTEFRVQLPRD